MIGDMVRPPCVVNAAHSSPIDRSQSSLPSLLSATTLAPHAERVDVAGLGVGGGRRPADAVRRHVALVDVELVLPDHLARYRRRDTSPAPAARCRGRPGSARRRDCPSRWAPSGRHTGARHRKFSPLSAHFSGSPVSADRPSRLGPRISGQSPSDTRRGPCPSRTDPRMKTAARKTPHFFSMTISLQAWTFFRALNR